LLIGESLGKAQINRSGLEEKLENRNRKRKNDTSPKLSVELVVGPLEAEQDLSLAALAQVSRRRWATLHPAGPGALISSSRPFRPHFYPSTIQT
jgi:hypothetical protein